MTRHPPESSTAHQAAPRLRRAVQGRWPSGDGPEGGSEIAVLQGYLPQQLTADELRAEVAAAIAAVGAKSAKDMGAVMKQVQPKVQGRAEGRAVSDEVKAQLAKLSS
jgi:hypothetical protein